MAAGDELWAGMRVLAIDEDRVCLKILEATLRRCNYNVTSVMDAKTALQRLREAKDPFDLVISELHMPDMDAFKLLRRIAVELGIPVIVLSAYEDTETVMKGLSSGACCYLAKPVSAEKIKNIWKHVSRRKVEARNQNNNDNDDVDHNVEAEQGAKAVRKNSLRNRNDRDDSHENNKENASKKPRLTWTTELHHKFLEAFNRLGDKAVPKRICEMMNVDYITRRNVASHLQKYRIYLQKQSDPSARASLKWNSYSNMSNLESFKHYHGHEIRPAYSTFASSSSHNHLAAQPIQLGSTLEDVLPPLSSAISRKTKASAKTLCGILLRTNQGTASSHLDYSFENMLDDEVLEPVNQLPVQSIEFVNQSSVLMNAPATNVNGALGDASKFPDLFGNCDNSWQTSAPSKFPGLIHKDETSVGLSPANIPKINHLTSFVGASSRQIPMSQSELQNPMAAFIRNTTPMVGLNQQMASFNIVSNTSSVEMPNGNFAPGSTSSTILPNLHTGNSATLTQMVNGLSNNYTLPHIEAESSVMSTQKLNGEDVGSIPVQEGMADQEGLDGQLNDNTEFSLDDIFAMDDLNFSQDNDLLNGDWF